MITSSNEESINYWHVKLRHYRNDFSDDIPDFEVTSLSQDRPHKCQRLWWQLWGGAVSQFERMGILSEDLVRKYHQVFDDYKGRIERDAFGVRPEDICGANELLDQILTALETRLG